MSLLLEKYPLKPGPNHALTAIAGSQLAKRPRRPGYVSLLENDDHKRNVDFNLDSMCFYEIRLGLDMPLTLLFNSKHRLDFSLEDD